MTRLSLLSVAIAAGLASPLAVHAQAAAPAASSAPAAQADKSDLDEALAAAEGGADARAYLFLPFDLLRGDLGQVQLA